MKLHTGGNGGGLGSEDKRAGDCKRLCNQFQAKVHEVVPVQ
jgi:hypothetical protein